MADFYSEPPDAVFLLAAASRLVAVHRTPNLGLDSLATIVRLWGPVRERILRDIVNRLHSVRATDCARHCAQIVQRKNGGLRR